MTQDLVNTSGASNVALSGYDPVAFFTVSMPMNGDFNATCHPPWGDILLYNGAEQAHVRIESRQICSSNRRVLHFWRFGRNTAQVYKDKLYVNLNPGILDMFNQDRDDAIVKAETNWAGLVAKDGV